MLFRKKIECSCEYCQYGTQLNDEYFRCTKRGDVAHQDNCRKFKYDPCKRIPSKQKSMDFGQYDDHDFSL